MGPAPPTPSPLDTQENQDNNKIDGSAQRSTNTKPSSSSSPPYSPTSADNMSSSTSGKELQEAAGKITPFDGRRENYETWAWSVKASLIGIDAWENLQQSTENMSGNELTKWKRSDGKAYSVIYMSLKDHLKARYHAASGGQALWKEIQATYAMVNAIQLAHILAKLWADKKKADENIQEYLDKKHSLWQKFVKQGVKIDSDFMFIAATLANLDDNWLQIGNNILATLNIENVNISAVEAVLYQAEEYDPKLQAKVTSSSSTTEGGTAMLTNSGRPKKGKGCPECGKRGHKLEECWVKHEHLRPEWYRQAAERKKSPQPDSKRNDDKGKGKASESGENAFFTAESALLTAALLTKGSLAPGVVPDTGATSHYLIDKSMFTTFETCRIPIMTSEKGRTIYATGQGRAELWTGGQRFELAHALYAPDLSTPLLSLSTVQHNLHNYKSVPGGLEINLNDGRKIFCPLTATSKRGKLYYIPLDKNKPGADQPAETDSSLLTTTKPTPAEIWHERLGHPGQKVSTQLASMYDITLPKADEYCEGCQLSKSTGLPARARPEQSLPTKALERVHTDVMGPFGVPSYGGAQYVLTFIDDFTSKVWAFPMIQKSQTFEVFKVYHAMVERMCESKLKVLRSDNGGEYTGEAFKTYCQNQGIVRELTGPYTPLQNCKAERMNRSLQEIVRAWILKRHLDQRLWAELFVTAAYVKNVLPSSAPTNGGKSPDHMWFGKVSTVSHLRAIGCRVLVHIPKEQRVDGHLRGKLGPRARLGELVGYVDVRTYRIHVGNGNVMTSRNVVFDEQGSIRDGKEAMGLEVDIPVPPTSSTQAEQQPSAPVIASDSNAADTEGNNNSEENATPVVSESTTEAQTEEGPAAVDPQDTAPAPMPTLLSGGPPHESVQVSRRSVSATPPPRYTSQEPEGSMPGGFMPSNTTIVEGEPSNVADLGETANNTGTSDTDGGSRSDSSRRSRTTTSRYGINTHGVLLTADDDEPEMCFLTPVRDVEDPDNYKAALETPHAKEWKEAVGREMASMAKNEVWEVVNKVPPGHRVLGMRVVLKVKRDQDGEIAKFKARAVVLGYLQQQGRDYKETFAPVSRMATFRLLLAKATQLGLFLVHLDIETAFLYGKIDTELYVQLPLEVTNDRPVFVKMKKSCYGLKQAPLIWHRTLAAVLKQLGFSPVEGDPCLFQRIRDNTTAWLLVYVDDFILATYTREEGKAFIDELSRHFTVKDLGVPTYYLGIKVHYDRERGEASINQKAYFEAIIKHFGLDEANPTSYPMAPGADNVLEKDTAAYLEEVTELYGKAVGKLQYGATCTRPDIAYPVRVVAMYNQKVTPARWNAVKTIIRYLKGTLDSAITYSRVNPNQYQLTGFSDANWKRTGDCLSTTGYVVLLCGGAVSWACKKQKKVATSTQQAELNAALSASKDIVWLRKFPLERPEESSATVLFVDNQSAIHWIAGRINFEAGKHYEVDLQFVREKVKDGTVDVRYIRSEGQLADVLTKALPAPTLIRCKQGLGMTE